MDLADITKQIGSLHSTYGRIIRQGIVQARAIGDLLLQAKTLVERGEWMGWIEANMPFSYRSAVSFMLIAFRWDDIKDAVEAGTMNFDTARKTLKKPGGSYEKKHRGLSDLNAPNYDPLTAAKSASDGDLIEMLLSILAERDNAAEILGRVADMLPAFRRAV